MIKSMDVTELKLKLEAKENIILVDCREQGEWDEAHIDGAILIPLSIFQVKHQDHLTNKDATIVMQCRSGKRSMNACMLLEQEGYTDLYNLEGGILAWAENGFETK